MTEREGRLEEHIMYHTKCLDDHEKRIRGIEKSRWKSEGAKYLLAFVAPLVATLIAVWMTKA